MEWRPGADIDTLRRRAALLATLRQFFAARGVLEVETPLLCRHGVTDPSLEPFQLRDTGGDRYLQTSPEYAMKRLLAARREPVFQVGKAFRAGEAGPRHNPEFTLLEWYRPGYDHHRLMEEVVALVNTCLGERPLRQTSYRELFRSHLDIDPFTAPAAELRSVAREHVDAGDLAGDRDLWLDLLMSHVIEPRLDGLCLVYDYPATQAALARVVADGDSRVGQRFEVYVDGLELANGYCELTDAQEQRRRFEADNARRRERGQPEHPVDEFLLAALEHGLPECSGVALGIDRLLMLMVGSEDIRDVLAFDWHRS